MESSRRKRRKDVKSIMMSYAVKASNERTKRNQVQDTSNDKKS